jgi:hypothetical protein
VTYIQDYYGLCTQRACRLVKQVRSTHYYRSVKDSQTVLRQRMHEIAQTRLLEAAPHLLLRPRQHEADINHNGCQGFIGNPTKTRSAASQVTNARRKMTAQRCPQKTITAERKRPILACLSDGAPASGPGDYNYSAVSASPCRSAVWPTRLIGPASPPAGRKRSWYSPVPRNWPITSSSLRPASISCSQ